jgi:hypothetical protein
MVRGFLGDRVHELRIVPDSIESKMQVTRLFDFKFLIAYFRLMEPLRGTVLIAIALAWPSQNSIASRFRKSKIANLKSKIVSLIRSFTWHKSNAES